MQADCANQDLLRAYRRHLKVGRLFAFLDQGMASVPGVQWLASRAPWPMILPLSTPRVDLPGLALHPRGLPDLVLGVLASDRDLYRPGRDPIRLLLADPLRPLGLVALNLVRNGVPRSTETVRLDRHGAGVLYLPPLPEGLYTASRPGRPANQACTFRVAPHRLAPFTALLVSCKEVAGRPEARDVALHLERFGQAYQGPLRGDLLVRGQRVGKVGHWAESGRAVFRIPVQREGAHQLHVQIPGEPECTATVSVTAASWDGQGRARLSSRGFAVEAGLHPGLDTHPLRGLHLAEGCQEGPFRLERTVEGAVRLVAHQEVGPILAILRDPLGPAPLQSADTVDMIPHLALALLGLEEIEETPDLPGLRGANRRLLEAVQQAAHGCAGEAADLLWEALEGGVNPDRLPDFGRQGLLDSVPLAARLLGPRERVEQRGRMEPGEVLEFQTPSPAGILTAGAWVNGAPWEGWAVCLAPEAASLRLEAPGEARPGQEFPLQIDLGDREGSVLVTVRDARRTAAAPLAERLARSLVDFAARMEEVGGTGPGFEEVRLDVARPPSEKAPKARPHLDAAGLRRVASALTAGGLLDLDLVTVDPQLARCLPEHLTQRYKCLPVLAADNTMILAIVDPGNKLAIDDVALITGFDVVPVAAREDQVVREIRRQFGVTELVCVEQSVGEVCDDPGMWPHRPPPQAQELSGRLAEPGPQSSDVLDVHFLSCVRGQVTLPLRVPEDGGTCEVEALLLSGGDWSGTRATVRVEPGPRPILRLPAFLRAGEEVLGRLTVAGDREDLQRLELWRDGQPVDLEEREGVCVFPALPGLYRAVSVDHVGAVREDLAEVRHLAERVLRYHSLRWLTRGDRLRRQDEGWLEVQEIPGVRPVLARLLRALVEYPHGCCEQTAARAAAAAAEWWLRRDQPGPREQAERDLRELMARLEAMVLSPGAFRIYPDSEDRAPYSLARATEGHLQQLRILDAPSLPRDLKILVERALSWTSGDASQDRLAEQYLASRQGKSLKPKKLEVLRSSARSLAEKPLAQPGLRATASYTAAILLRTGQEEDRRLATRLANEVMRRLVGGGRLYSTLDSMAAVALLREMEGTERPPAVRWSEDRSEVEVLEGDLLLALVQECPARYADGVPPFQARLVSERTTVERASPGILIDLVVELLDPLDPYAPGDTMRIYLPETLAWMEGGGLVRELWLDFEGRSSLRVPLVVVEEGGRPLYLQLENMYSEARGGPPVPLPFIASGALPTGEPGPSAVASVARHLSPDVQTRLDDLIREGLEAGAEWLHLEPDPVRPHLRLRGGPEQEETTERTLPFRDLLDMVEQLKRACGLAPDSEAPGSRHFQWGERELQCHFLPGFHGLRVAVRLGPEVALGPALQEAAAALSSVRRSIGEGDEPAPGRLARARALVAAATVDTDGLSPGDPMRHLLDGLSRLLDVLRDPPLTRSRAVALCNHLAKILRTLQGRNLHI